jgi:hypothetical protein
VKNCCVRPKRPNMIMERILWNNNQQVGTTTEDYSMEASSEEQGEEQEQKKDELSYSFRVLDRPDHDETTKNRRKIAMAYVILQPFFLSDMHMHYAESR